MSKTERMKPAGVVGGIDQRRHERLRLDTQVKYKIINRRTAEEVLGPGLHEGLRPGLRPDGQSVNISLSGLAISTAEPLKKGDFIKLELSLPGLLRPSRSLAEVMWTRMEGGQNIAGVRFLIFLNETDDSSVRRFIEGQKQGRGE
jgi:hypothetical protein